MCSPTAPGIAASVTASTPARSSWKSARRADRVRRATSAGRPPARRYNRSVTGPDSEHELIRSAQAGDQDAFAELVAMHAGRVYGALRRFGLDAGEADEVSQEG